MLKNFIAMPSFLKLLTASAFLVPIFFINSMFLGQSIRVLGHKISISLWWSSGMGVITLVLSFIMVLSALLMLRRLYLGRSTYTVGWIVMVLQYTLSKKILGIEDAGSLSLLAYNAALTFLIVIYLYKNKSVSEYFSNGEKMKNK